MINEQLFKAVETGKADEVKKALTEEKINAATYYGAKSIVLAAEQGNSEILEMLLKNGEKINRESFWRRTAFSALRAAKNAENTVILELLLEYGAGADKKRLDSALTNDIQKSTSKTKFCYEEGIYIPEKSSKDYIFIQYAKEGKIKKVKDLLEEGVSEKAILGAVDAALEKNKWEIATILLKYSEIREVEIYTECLKKMFLKASYVGDIETVKFYLEKLIENAVGVLTDETGKTTLEIALESNPADIIKLLSNYGFNENALHYAYRCLSNKN
ncbi:MAG: ankyrin repeat domain-containing protein [Lentimicrobiaceae bacterium]|nr:ankyrin repeat domain-containing protein [Lentimicrobiaceae bacterium]